MTPNPKGEPTMPSPLSAPRREVIEQVSRLAASAQDLADVVCGPLLQKSSGYDWNGDPLGVILLTGLVYGALEYLECEDCGATGEYDYYRGNFEDDWVTEPCESCAGTGYCVKIPAAQDPTGKEIDDAVKRMIEAKNEHWSGLPSMPLPLYRAMARAVLLGGVIPAHKGEPT